MCRVYRCKRGWYVRLCSATGRKGERIAVPHGYVLERAHYACERMPRPAIGRLTTRPLPVMRCLDCGTALSRDNEPVGRCLRCQQRVLAELGVGDG